MLKRRDFICRVTGFITAMPFFSGNAYVQTYDIDRSKERLNPGIQRVRDGLKYARSTKKNNIPPLLREEILDNPDAVFIIKTNVISQKDQGGKFPPEYEQFGRTGYDTAGKIFRKGTEKGGTTYIKPNFVGGFNADARSVNSGITTHPSFVAGFCEALKEMGNTTIVVGANGGAKHENFVESGVSEIMHQCGVCFTEGKYSSWNDYRKDEITWIDYPEGIVMRKIPFFKLTKEPDTTFINMAKDRIHNLGITTLTIKNLQGIMPVGYMHICNGWTTQIDKGFVKNVFNPNFQREIERQFIQHTQMNYKYFDLYGFAQEYFDAGGWDAFKVGDFKPDSRIFWFEQWAQRIMDIASNIRPHINLVEGIVGIDGAGKLHLNNFITISRSMTACDSVASWLMGHDPRELYYTRIAHERGLGENNIEQITLYEIKERGIEKIKDYRNLPRAAMGVNIYNIDNKLRFF